MREILKRKNKQKKKHTILLFELNIEELYFGCNL